MNRKIQNQNAGKYQAIQAMVISKLYKKGRVYYF